MTVPDEGTVVCTITNTRIPPPPDEGTLTVRKVLSPATDPGRFNLQINGTTRGTGATSRTTAPPARSCSTAGDYTVGETAAGTTSLTNYTSQIACTTNGAPSESGNGTSLAGVTVPDEGTVVCTITNTRIPPPPDEGTLRCARCSRPPPTRARFNLQINGTTRGTGAAVS